MKGHLKHMLIGGGAVLVVLLLVGVSVRDALPWAVVLACPLMMVGMMFMMSRGMGAKGDADHQHGPHCSVDDAKDAMRADQGVWSPPAQEGRVAR